MLDGLVVPYYIRLRVDPRNFGEEGVIEPTSKPKGNGIIYFHSTLVYTKEKQALKLPVRRLFTSGTSSIMRKPPTMFWKYAGVAPSNPQMN